MSSERIMNLLVTIPAESRRMNVGKDVIRILGSPAYMLIKTQDITLCQMVCMLHFFF